MQNMMPFLHRHASRPFPRRYVTLRLGADDKLSMVTGSIKGRERKDEEAKELVPKLP